MAKTILWQDDMFRLEKLTRTQKSPNLFEHFINQNIGKPIELKLSSGYKLHCLLVFNGKDKKLLVVSKWLLELGRPVWMLINKKEILHISTEFTNDFFKH
jgi:hypothetical protein